MNFHGKNSIGFKIQRPFPTKNLTLNLNRSGNLQQKRLDTTSPSSFLPVKPSSTSGNRFGFFCSCRIAKSVPPRMSWGPWWHEAGTSTICAKMRSSSTKSKKLTNLNFMLFGDSFLGTSVPNLYLEDPKLLKSGRVMWLESTCPESSGFKVRRFVPFIWHILTLSYKGVLMNEYKSKG